MSVQRHGKSPVAAAAALAKAHKKKGFGAGRELDTGRCLTQRKGGTSAKALQRKTDRSACIATGDCWVIAGGLGLACILGTRLGFFSFQARLLFG